MFMKKFYRLLLVFSIAVLVSCSSLMQDIQVGAEMDPKARISGYKSYDWVDEATLLLNDPEGKWQPPNLDIAGKIKNLIEKELSSRGIVKDTTSPELVVSFFIGVDMEAMQLKLDPKSDTDMLKNIPKAGLIVVLIDVTTKFVIWMGTAEGEIHENTDDEKLSQRVKFAVHEMFKLLPGD
jgi:hypothetical protein